MMTSQFYISPDFLYVCVCVYVHCNVSAYIGMYVHIIMYQCCIRVSCVACIGVCVYFVCMQCFCLYVHIGLCDMCMTLYVILCVQ